MQSKHFFKAIAKCLLAFTIDYQWSSKEPLEKELWPARPAPDYDKCHSFLFSCANQIKMFACNGMWI